MARSKRRSWGNLLAAGACCLPGFTEAQMKPAEYVDPRIGNVAQLLVPTFPTFQQPNQMMRMVPIREGYLIDQISAFPLQVLSHRQPGILRMRLSVGPVTPQRWTQPMAIDHDLETVRPWFYETTLIDDDITVAFVPGRKAAIYALAFPPGDQKNILIQGSDGMVASAEGKHAFAVVETVTRSARSPAHPSVTLSIWCYGEVTDAQGRPAPGVRIRTETGRLSILCDASAPENLQLKYAISYVSPEQARRTFTAEVASENVADVGQSARAAWDAELSRITVKGGTIAQRRTFYTALYRTHERMVDICEEGHYFSGFDQRVHATDRPFYVDDWIWDTFRSQHPLRTILNPAQEEDMLHSYVEMSRQNDGWMPTFPGVTGNSPCMTGYHSSAMFLDAHRKGLSRFDLEAAYAAVRKNLTEGTWIPWRQGAPATELDARIREVGYMPALHPGETEIEPLVDTNEMRQAVAVSLGRSYDAWVFSELAKDLGRTEDHEIFADICSQYRKLWHPEQRLFMPKDQDGNWIDIDPRLDGGMGFRDYYDENNGWTYAWYLPHDIPGLVNLLGGPQAMVDRLDQFFREPLGVGRYQFQAIGPDSTGMIGQFSMGNEPSFHIPYLYNYCGAPWKTQQRTRLLLDVWFQDNLFGMPGDEDGGAMSAWVVFSAMGFYPVTPGVPVYAITSPIFSEVIIDLADGRQFAVRAPNSTARNKYIQKADLNGTPLETPFITHDQIMAGGRLTLELGERPNRTWSLLK